MTIAVRQVPGTPAERPTTTVAGHVARVAIFDSLAAAEPHWRALESGHALVTPYQQFDLLQHWQQHIGGPSGIEPLIVVAFDAAGDPLAVLPFGRRRYGGLRIAGFLGDEHINFHMALWRRDFAQAVTRVELDGILAQLSQHADAVTLINQPVTWNGMRNPMAMLPQQPSPSFSHSGTLGADFDKVLESRTTSSARKKLRKKAETLGTARFARTESPEETRRILDVFFAQKGDRLRAVGIPSVFDEPQVRGFLDAAATAPAESGKPPIELYALWAGDTVVATMGGIAGDGRFCGMFNSINPSEFTTASPGDQMLINLARHCCERGFHTFDLGVGEARYKNLICNDIDLLFDSFIGLSPAGRLLAIAARSQAKAKRLVKQTPALWSLVEAARRLRARFVSA